MVGRSKSPARRDGGGQKKDGSKRHWGTAHFDPPSRPATEPCWSYLSAALRAVFRFRRRASAAFRALASLGFT